MSLLQSLWIATKYSLLVTEETRIPCGIEWQARHLMINLAQAAHLFSLVKGNPWLSVMCQQAANSSICPVVLEVHPGQMTGVPLAP